MLQNTLNTTFEDLLSAWNKACPTPRPITAENRRLDIRWLIRDVHYAHNTLDVSDDTIVNIVNTKKASNSPRTRAKIISYATGKRGFWTWYRIITPQVDTSRKDTMHHRKYPRGDKEIETLLTLWMSEWKPNSVYKPAARRMLHALGKIDVTEAELRLAIESLPGYAKKTISDTKTFCLGPKGFWTWLWETGRLIRDEDATEQDTDILTDWEKRTKDFLKLDPSYEKRTEFPKLDPKEANTLGHLLGDGSTPVKPPIPWNPKEEAVKAFSTLVNSKAHPTISQIKETISEMTSLVELGLHDAPPTFKDQEALKDHKMCLQITGDYHYQTGIYKCTATIRRTSDVLNSTLPLVLCPLEAGIAWCDKHNIPIIGFSTL